MNCRLRSGLRWLVAWHDFIDALRRRDIGSAAVHASEIRRGRTW
jgi:hypothetical protein